MMVVRGGVEPPTCRFSVTVIRTGQAGCSRRFVQPTCSNGQFLMTMLLSNRAAMPCAAKSDKGKKTWLLDGVERLTHARVSGGVKRLTQT
jgi:hypothetical protein